MAFQNYDNGMVMPVAPMYGGGFGGGNGMFGGDGAWWLILLILLGAGGMWGGYGMGGMMGAGMVGFDMLYPWMNQANQISDGFRDQMINDNVTEIRTGVNGIQNQLCNGFAGTTAAITGAQNAITQQLYTNQIADLQATYGVQSALQNCCCENRAGLADLKYTVATENCADRTAAYQNTRDIIDSQTRGIQTIMDKLCALELDGYKRENDNLRSQLTAANLAASQIAQTSQIVDQTYNRLATCPVGTVPVFGEQEIFRCSNVNGGGCGCGCGNNF